MSKRTIKNRIAQAQENKGDWDYEDPKLPRADWRAEVANNDTQLGYFDWVINNLEGQLP